MTAWSAGWTTKLVAQSCTLPYRRIVFCGASPSPSTLGLAGALPIGNLRYGSPVDLSSIPRSAQYLTKPVAKDDLLAAIRVRLARAAQQATPEFKPNFASAKPLEKELGLTPRVAETLLWLAQGKTNSDIATILGNSESTVKKHVLEIFAKLGVETRTAASLRALEVLSSPAAKSG
ncbi:MAG: response regulator transcription factor [Verrucomicrobia bacterium]|nr:response regulator transcription factor [Verrucomicrobiota bacterium]